jgi:hypothetical protein
MELEPSDWQRKREALLIRFRPEAWLLPALQDRSSLGWIRILFVRWIFALLWVLPWLTLGLLFFLVLLVLALPVLLGALLLDLFFTLWGKDSTYRSSLVYLGKELAFRIFVFALKPEIWLDSHRKPNPPF